MENEIAAHRAGIVARAVGRARRGGRERAGDLPRPGRVEAALRRDVAAARGAARRHRQPRRHVAPGRVPRRSGRTTPSTARRSPRAEGDLARSGAALPHARLLFVRSGERRGSGRAARLLRQHDERRQRLRRLELDRLRRPARPRPRTRRRARRPPALPRLHARQARPLLRRTAGRSTTPFASRSTRTGSGSRPTSAATASRATSSRCRRASTSAGSRPRRPGRVLEAALAGRVHLPHYRGRSCHSFAAQAAERAVREETGCSASPTCSVRRSSAPARAGGPRSRPAERCTRSTCAVEQGEADAPHVLDGGAQAAAALRRRNPSRTSRLTSTSRPASSSEPGRSAARNGPPR